MGSAESALATRWGGVFRAGVGVDGWVVTPLVSRSFSTRWSWWGVT